MFFLCRLYGIAAVYGRRHLGKDSTPSFVTQKLGVTELRLAGLERLRQVLVGARVVIKWERNAAKSEHLRESQSLTRTKLVGLNSAQLPGEKQPFIIKMYTNTCMRKGCPENW